MSPIAAPRAYTTVVLAMSADGKITDHERTAARFSSPQDLSHLETEIARSDGVLFGASTLRAYGTCLPVRQAQLLTQRQVQHQPPQPVQIVCSRSGRISPHLRFFQQPVPRWLLTTEAGAASWQSQDQFDRILHYPLDPQHWPQVLQHLHGLGIHRLAVLGGGTLVSSLVEQDVIDELHLTVCPLLLGGQNTPTPVDGTGLSIALATRLTLLEVKTIENEVFLHYRRCHPKRD